jgi:hypothetical protein
VNKSYDTKKYNKYVFVIILHSLFICGFTYISHVQKKRIPCSEMQCHAVWWKFTYTLEEPAASTFGVEQHVTWEYLGKIKGQEESTST